MEQMYKVQQMPVVVKILCLIYESYGQCIASARALRRYGRSHSDLRLG